MIELEEFNNTYKPIKNHLDKNASYDGQMFETYDEELKYVIEVNKSDASKVWTLVTADNGEDLYIIAGMHFVNRQGFFITEKSWEDSDFQVNLNETITVADSKTLTYNFCKQIGCYFSDEALDKFYESNI